MFSYGQAKETLACTVLTYVVLPRNSTWNVDPKSSQLRWYLAISNQVDSDRKPTATPWHRRIFCELDSKGFRESCTAGLERRCLKASGFCSLFLGLRRMPSLLKTLSLYFLSLLGCKKTSLLFLCSVDFSLFFWQFVLGGHSHGLFPPNVHHNLLPSHSKLLMLRLFLTP